MKSLQHISSKDQEGKDIHFYCLANILLEVLTSAIRQPREIRTPRLERKVKQFLLEDVMIIYVENLKETK